MQAFNSLKVICNFQKWWTAEIIYELKNIYILKFIFNKNCVLKKEIYRMNNFERIVKMTS